LAGFYVVSSLYISAHRQLWFDEILTALVSRLPNLRVMWKALSEIEDQTPPVYFLITRTFDQMFHHDDIGLRVPSAIALGAGLLVTFDTARRLTDGLYGLIAMSVLATPFVTYYGYEARAYAIYLMFAAIALWLWVFTKAESKTAAATFGAVFLIGVAIHYYFVLCLLPFGIMALAQRRIFHPKVMAATAGVMVSLAVLYPQIAKSRAFAKSISPVWAPSIVRLLAAYQGLLPNVTLLLVFIAIGLVVFSKPRNHLATP
jgi:4-amino-4-deoxy-L-arabinose transferase-like glycosyltransferase